MIDHPVVIIAEIPKAYAEVYQDSLDVRLDTVGNEARDRWSGWTVVDGVEDFVGETLPDDRHRWPILYLYQPGLTRPIANHVYPLLGE